jgi:DNA polymerase-4
MTESVQKSEVKKIIHVDMDAFYASVEQHDFPQYKGKPIAVGGSKDRGVVAAASYEARKYGVRSAMASSIAARLCPELIFVRPRFDRYQAVSKQIQAIFYEYTDLVEPLSLDEAFLDVTFNKKGMISATQVATEIRRRIFETTGLTASAGISINKFTAKMASDINKPNGQLTIPPDAVESFLEELPIDSFFGIGKVTAVKMKELGVRKGKDLKKKSLNFLIQHFGKSGQHFYDIVRGIQHSVVKPDRERKSLAVENTYAVDLISTRAILEQLELLSATLEKRLEKRSLHGRTLTLKVKFNDFSQLTRSRTVFYDLSSKEQFFEIAELLVESCEFHLPVRLLGLSLSKLHQGEDLNGDNNQLTMQF